MARTSVYRIFWLGVFAAMIVVGAPYLGKPPLAISLVDHGPDSSVNAILNQTLGQPELAGPISAWLSELPANRPILILAAPNDVAAGITMYSVAYLAWPRPVVLSQEQGRSIGLLQKYRENYAAVALCYLPPPPGLSLEKQFGPMLGFIVPHPPVSQ